MKTKKLQLEMNVVDEYDGSKTQNLVMMYKYYISDVKESTKNMKEYNNKLLTTKALTVINILKSMR